MPIKSKDTEISIIGDGGWGTSLAILLAKKGHRCTIWGAFRRYVKEVEALRENRKFLPGFHIPENVEFEIDLDRAVHKKRLVVLAVPSQYLRSVLKQISRENLGGVSFLCVTKGIETQSLKLPSNVIQDVLGHVPLAVLSGPTIAREVVSDMPTAVVVASGSKILRSKTRQIFNTDHFTVYESDDLVGVQLGGAIKNVIAIAAGIVDGLGYGCNTKSVLVARGIAEIARLGLAMGAKRTTFMGLSGLGDLATTSFSVHSRNHACGVEIGKGRPLHAVQHRTAMVIEGVETAKAAYRLSKKRGIEMPIVHAVYHILFGARKPRAAIEALMHKKLVNETD